MRKQSTQSLASISITLETGVFVARAAVVGVVATVGGPVLVVLVVVVVVVPELIKLPAVEVEVSPVNLVLLAVVPKDLSTLL